MRRLLRLDPPSRRRLTMSGTDWVWAVLLGALMVAVSAAAALSMATPGA